MEEKEKEIEIENGDEKVCEEQAGINGDETAASQTENETTADKKKQRRVRLMLPMSRLPNLKTSICALLPNLTITANAH